MKSTDRRIARTLAALREAMISLIIEKGFEATSISEITERANVGRSTFYAHYADKNDLLQGSVEQLANYLHEQILSASQPEGRRDIIAFAMPMLEHANESRPLFKAMFGKKSGHLFQELCSDILRGFVREAKPDIDEIAEQCIVGAFFASMIWWLDKAPHQTAAEVHERFCSFIYPSLSVLNQS